MSDNNDNIPAEAEIEGGGHNTDGMENVLTPDNVPPEMASSIKNAKAAGVDVSNTTVIEQSLEDHLAQRDSEQEAQLRGEMEPPQPPPVTSTEDTLTPQEQERAKKLQAREEEKRKKKAKSIYGDYPETDPSLRILQKYYPLTFTHIPTRGSGGSESVIFPAWLTTFEDTYESAWNQEQVYGRMDPLSTFQGTTRTITLSWDVVAYSLKEAVDNMDRCERLFRMLYPTYKSQGTNPHAKRASGKSTRQTGSVDKKKKSAVLKTGVKPAYTPALIHAAPLIRVKFANLIHSAIHRDTYRSRKNGSSGVLGTISGFTYAPNLEAEFFNPMRETQFVYSKKEVHNLYPQEINLSCVITVVHEHKLGWDNVVRKPRTARFPYGAKNKKKK